MLEGPVHQVWLKVAYKELKALIDAITFVNKKHQLLIPTIHKW
jgi:hypothetical protein